ncbi:MAG: hypothetical protein AB7O64_20025 [Methylibium sp.]
MSNFLVVIPAPEHHDEALRAFERGVAKLRAQSGMEPSVLRHSTWFVATVPRRNGSGGALTADVPTQSFLVSAGVWFESSGGGSHEPMSALKSFTDLGALRFADRLEGFLAIVAGDGRSGEVSVITDLIGACHVYERNFQFATALSGSSLLLASLAPTSVDGASLRSLITTGAIYDESRTLFDEIRKLPANRVSTYGRRGLVSAQSYWSVAALPLGSLSGAKAADALWDSMTAAMRRIGSAYGRVVCDVTGGHDSRTILATCLGAPLDVHTTVTGAARNPDVLIGRRLAEVAHKPLVWYESLPPPAAAELDSLTWLTDGEADVIEYARVAAVHRQLKQRFDISLNGSILEAARGYWWELLPTLGSSGRPFDAEMLSRRRFLAEPFDATIFGTDPMPELREQVSGMIRYATHGLEGMPLSTQMDASYLLTRMQRWHGRIASSTNRLWPSLAPALMRSALEVMLSADSKTRERSHLVRLMLARHRPDLAAIPMESGYPPMPFSLRNAHRFWPIVPLYARRAVNKAHRMLTSRPLVMATDGESQRMTLWNDRAMEELLDPARMRLADLLDRPSLGRFLEASKRADFAFDEQWRCLVSAELALRAANAE